MSNKLAKYVAKARHDMREHLKQNKHRVTCSVSEKKLNTAVDKVPEYLADIRVKGSAPTRKANGLHTSAHVTADVWDDLLCQIKNVCHAVQEPLLYVDWEALLGRFSHSELTAWISAWRTELTKRKHAALKKAKPNHQGKKVTVYDIALDTLRMQSHVFENNLKVLIAALDQSAVNTNTAYIALNVLIKQMQFWCPVFHERPL
jgi:hypothetical protein